MSLMDFISIAALLLIVVTIGIVVYRLSKLAQEEKKHSALKKRVHHKHIRVIN